jgi:hypothetical protein
VAATLTLLDYVRRVQREAGYQESASLATGFNATSNTDERIVIDSINSALRELNNTYYLAFKLSEYTLTTTANVAEYDLTLPPYNVDDFTIYRMARNGVINAEDIPLVYIDYTQRDSLRPNITGSSGIPTFYSGYGNKLLIWPRPGGEELKIRYYSKHIGTDAAGTTKKTTLTEADDVTMLNDEWQDCLVYNAACKAYRPKKADAKFFELKRMKEEWEKQLVGLAKPAGEDATPRIALGNESYSDIQSRRYFPFGTTWDY